jgi:ATP-dependent Clp protease ATP-binding subunit ClpA
MFERFTQDARSVVRNAVAEAERRGDRHTGTEHLVLAAVASANRITASIMDAAGIDLALTARPAPDPGQQLLSAVGVDHTDLHLRIREALRRAA